MVRKTRYLMAVAATLAVAIATLLPPAAMASATAPPAVSVLPVPGHRELGEDLNELRQALIGLPRVVVRYNNQGQYVVTGEAWVDPETGRAYVDGLEFAQTVGLQVDWSPGTGELSFHRKNYRTLTMAIGVPWAWLNVDNHSRDIRRQTTNQDIDAVYVIPDLAVPRMVEYRPQVPIRAVLETLFPEMDLNYWNHQIAYNGGPWQILWSYLDINANISQNLDGTYPRGAVRAEDALVRSLGAQEHNLEILDPYDSSKHIRIQPVLGTDCNLYLMIFVPHVTEYPLVVGIGRSGGCTSSYQWQRKQIVEVEMTPTILDPVTGMWQPFPVFRTFRISESGPSSDPEAENAPPPEVPPAGQVDAWFRALSARLQQVVEEFERLYADGFVKLARSKDPAEAALGRMGPRAYLYYVRTLIGEAKVTEVLEQYAGQTVPWPKARAGHVFASLTEKIAAGHLQRAGYMILKVRNSVTANGPDIIAIHTTKFTTAICEVKCSAAGTNFGTLEHIFRNRVKWDLETRRAVDEALAQAKKSGDSRTFRLLMAAQRHLKATNQHEYFIALGGNARYKNQGMTLFEKMVVPFYVDR